MELAKLEHEAEAERGLWQQQLLETKMGIEEKAARVREPHTSYPGPEREGYLPWASWYQIVLYKQEMKVLSSF